jgi:thiol peroxidase
MAQVKFKGSTVELNGKFPQVGDILPDLKLTSTELTDVSLSSFKLPYTVLNIFPSVDTPVCSESVIKFNQVGQEFSNCNMLCISKDLPFAQARFCGTKDIKNAKTLSAFRYPENGEKLGVEITESPLKGLFARAVIVIDNNRKVIYTELVPEVTDRPDYDACLKIIASL